MGRGWHVICTIEIRTGNYVDTCAATKRVRSEILSAATYDAVVDIDFFHGNAYLDV